MNKQKETFIPANHLKKSSQHWSETNQTLTLGGTVLSKDQLKKNFSQSQLKFLKAKVSEYIERTLQSNDCSHQIYIIIFAFLSAVQKSDSITIQTPPLNHAIFQNKKLGLVKCLGQIQFRNLIRLNIRYQKITSIDGIAFVDAPQLIALMIDNNNITNICGLIKSHFPRLQKLGLSQNPIIDINQIYRMRHYFITQYTLVRACDSESNFWGCCGGLCYVEQERGRQFQGEEEDEQHDYDLRSFIKFRKSSHIDKRFLAKIAQAGLMEVRTDMELYERKLFQKLRQTYINSSDGINYW